MHISDWYPTFCGLANISSNDTGPGRVPIDGLDMWSALTMNLTSPHTELILGLGNGTNGALISADGFKIVVGPQTTPFWWGPEFPNKTLSCFGPETPDNVTTSSLDLECPVACSVTPCLFNILSDPSEYHDLATDEPALLAQMMQRYLQLVQELSAPNSDDPQEGAGVVWKDGYHVDVRGIVSPGCLHVYETGWWQPWVD